MRQQLFRSIGAAYGDGKDVEHAGPREPLCAGTNTPLLQWSFPIGLIGRGEQLQMFDGRSTLTSPFPLLESSNSGALDE
jgi:hypothetical protein